MSDFNEVGASRIGHTNLVQLINWFKSIGLNRKYLEKLVAGIIAKAYADQDEWPAA